MIWPHRWSNRSTTGELAARGYTHRAYTFTENTGRREILRDGRVVATLGVPEVNEWIRRLDAKMRCLVGAPPVRTMSAEELRDLARAR